MPISPRRTAAQTRDLCERVAVLIEELEAEEPEDGAERVTVMFHAFPRPGEVGTGESLW